MYAMDVPLARVSLARRRASCGHACHGRASHKCVSHGVPRIGVPSYGPRATNLHRFYHSVCLGADTFGRHFALADIFGYTRPENGMTSPHTNLYENASKASHYRRRHLVVAAAL
jgi:hypothetical protein